MLKKLWRSTRDLHKRFNLFPPNRVSMRKVFAEEFREVLDAARECDAILKLPPEQRTVDDMLVPRQHLAEEIADLFVTGLGMIDAYEVSRHELWREIDHVICKNNDKIPGVTHEVNKAGKIARIKRGEVKA